MNKDERIKALQALAKKHPYAEDVGYLWKNPLNIKSRGIRWNASDMQLFRLFQMQSHKILI